MIDFGETQTGNELKKLIPEYPMHFLDLSRFNLKSLIQKREQRKEEDERMCKALDDLVAEGELKGKAEFVLDLLEEHGIIPDSLKETILKQTDISVLKTWHKLAAHVGSIDEFVKESSLVV